MLPGLQRKEQSRAEAEIESEIALWFLRGARQHEAGFELHPNTDPVRNLNHTLESKRRRGAKRRLVLEFFCSLIPVISKNVQYEWIGKHSCLKWPLEEIYNLIFEHLTYCAILVPNWNT